MEQAVRENPTSASRHTVSQLAAQGQSHPEIMGTGFVVFGILATQSPSASASLCTAAPTARSGWWHRSVSPYTD